MKLLQVYNQYRSLFGGEETVVRRIDDLVKKSGGESRLLMRTSRGLDASLRGKARAFLSGIYNPFAAREVARFARVFRPDVAHVHNLYPLYSPSVLSALRQMSIPVVMTVHNHFHTCPTADHLRDGVVCESCVGGREYNCVRFNCRRNLLESSGYALRSSVARVFRLFVDNVSVVIALNEFARKRLILAGFDPQRVVVLPNAVDIPDRGSEPEHGRYAVFSGRMCPEKGVDTLLGAAALMPDLPVRLLGGGETLAEHQRSAPSNAVFLGQVSSDAVQSEYRQARFLVVPSRWFEGCPLVILEAMAHGLPVIASRIGGLPELVEDGITGLLFEPGDDQELAARMLTLWQDPQMCARMGRAGREKAIREFGEERYWETLISIYATARQGRPVSLP